MRKVCAYRVSNSTSNVLGKQECQGMVRYKFGDGTLTCARHRDKHRAALYGAAILSLKVALTATNASMRRRVAEIVKESQCDPA